MRYGLRRESTTLKILALRIGARRERLYIKIPGRFAQKGQRQAERVFEAVRQEAASAAERYRWKLVPRARIAVEMRFFSSHAQIPALHNLVKGYLDPLKGVVFKDDGQVACLAATCWRPPAAFSDKERETENTLFIMVERLADCLRRFDLWQAVETNSEFRDARAGRSWRSDDDEDRDSWDRDDGPFDERWLDQLGVPEDSRAQWRQFKLVEFQKRLLAGNRVEWNDRPGGAPKRLAAIGALWRRQAIPLLFSLDLRGLPKPGESRDLRADVRERLMALGERWATGRFVVPVELDVQVPEDPGAEATDLDNIMRRYIAPALGDRLLRAPDGYLHGYRIYRVRSAGRDHRAIRIRLMSAGAIQGFEERIDETLSTAREWLQDALRGF